MRWERRWRPRARAERGRYRQREGIRSRRRDGVERTETCKKGAGRVRVKEDRRHIGKTAGAHANLLVTSFQERRAWKQRDRRRGILGYFVWVRWRRERGHRSTQEDAVNICGVVQGRSNAQKNCGKAAQEACQESMYRLQRNVVSIAGRGILEKIFTSAGDV